MRKRIYVACPIAKGDRVHNIRQADEAMAALMRAGFGVFNPALCCFAGNVARHAVHGHVYARADHANCDLFRGFSHADWLDMDLSWVAVADAVLRLPGESKGADIETAFAERNGIPVFTDVDRLVRHFAATPVPPVIDWAGVGKWDRRYLEMAEFVSRWSKDPSTQTGAVIVDRDGSVASVGFNGFAKGVGDAAERYADRDLKYRLVVHCERNALLFARRDLRGCTLYTWPFMSCSACAGMVIQAGITRVVAPEVPADKAERWAVDMAIARQQFDEAGVEVHLVPWKSG